MSFKTGCESLEDLLLTERILVYEYHSYTKNIKS